MKRNLHAGGMRSRGLSVNVFTESELDDIHLATLEVLERTGVFVEADDARDIFKDGGCAVDSETRIVRIPPHIVEDAIASSPSKYVLCGRDPKNDFLMEPGRLPSPTSARASRVIDSETGACRESTLQDVADIARLNDYLSEMDTHEISVGAREVPPETAAVPQHRGAAPQHHQADRHRAALGHGVPRHPRMCAEIVGGEDALRERPIVYGGVCPVSPLKLPRDATEVIIECSRWGSRTTSSAWRMAGGIQPGHRRRDARRPHNAEVLAGDHAGAARPSAAPGDVRQLHDGDGPQARGGLRRLAGDLAASAPRWRRWRGAT